MGVTATGMSLDQLLSVISDTDNICISDACQIIYCGSCVAFNSSADYFSTPGSPDINDILAKEVKLIRAYNGVIAISLK